MRRTTVAAASCVLVVLIAASAGAQSRTSSADAPRRGSFEVGGGIIWSGGFELGPQGAELTANSTGNDALPFTLFQTDSRVGSIIGVQGRAGFYMTPALAFEAGVQYSRPVLTTRITEDFEDAEGLTATETINRYVFDGSLLLHLRRFAFAGGRGMPFLSIGAGYLRELHERNELVETGTSYHASGGFKLWLSQGRRTWGLRADAGAVLRDGGFNGDTARRTLPTASASLIFLF